MLSKTKLVKKETLINTNINKIQSCSFLGVKTVRSIICIILIDVHVEQSSHFSSVIQWERKRSILANRSITEPSISDQCQYSFSEETRCIHHRQVLPAAAESYIRYIQRVPSPTPDTYGGCWVLHPVHTAAVESYIRYIRRVPSPTPDTYDGCRVLHPVHTATAESYTWYILRMPSPTPNTKSCIAYPNNVWLQLVHTLSRDLFMHNFFFKIGKD